MRIEKNIHVCTLLFPILTVIMLSFIMVSHAYATIPDGLIIEDEFIPGYGEAVGSMQLVQGKVVITHKGISSGFIARKGTPLFQNDTIYTDKNGRAKFQLNDGSIMTLSYSTELTINQSIYDPRKKQQSSFLSLNIGKARFWVIKLLEYKNTTFKVKTSTFVAGVRGSDFIIVATPEEAELTALGDTRVDITSLAAPDAPPVRVSSYQKTMVKLGGLPHLPVNVPMKEIESLLKEFRFQDDKKDSEDGGFSGKEKETENKSGMEQSPAEIQIPPEALGQIDLFKTSNLPPIPEKTIPLYMEQKDIYTQSRINTILEDAELVLPPLPEMPGTP